MAETGSIADIFEYVSDPLLMVGIKFSGKGNYKRVGHPVLESSGSGTILEDIRRRLWDTSAK